MAEEKTEAKAAERTELDKRRDYVSSALQVTKADAAFRIRSLAGCLAAKKELQDGPALDAVLEIDPERLLDLLAYGPAEAAKLVK